MFRLLMQCGCVAAACGLAACSSDATNEEKPAKTAATTYPPLKDEVDDTDIFAIQLDSDDLEQNAQADQLDINIEQHGGE